MNEFFPLYTQQGNTATITLRRPREHNRLDPQDLSVLSDQFARAQNDDSVQLLVITGSGEKTFCAGYTIEAIATELDLRFEQTLNQLEHLDKPSLCALNGHVYGGGIDLALCCDFRIGLVGLQAFMPAARFGLHYHADGLRRFCRQLGPAAAKQLLLTGMTLDDQALLRCGFVSCLVSDPMALDKQIAQYANALAQCEPGAVNSMKKQINEIAAHDAHAAIDRRGYLKTLQSPQLKARLAARAAGK
jgi:enoyl-CoA hydratase/carnithine racemase